MKPFTVGKLELFRSLCLNQIHSASCWLSRHLFIEHDFHRGQLYQLSSTAAPHSQSVCKLPSNVALHLQTILVRPFCSISIPIRDKIFVHIIVPNMILLLAISCSARLFAIYRDDGDLFSHDLFEGLNP